MINIGTFKQGTTFSMPVQLFPVIDDVPVEDLDGYTIKSQLRTSTLRLIETLDVSTEANSTVVLVGCDDTTEWPVGPAFLDILLTDGEVVLTSATMQIRIVDRITHND